MSKDIFVFAEQREGIPQRVGIELIGKAKELASALGQRVYAVLMGYNIKNLAGFYIEYGADEVIIVDHSILETYVTEPYAKAMCTLIKEYDPEIVLFGATSIGRDLAPRVSARVHTGLTADCTGLVIDGESKLLQMTRPAFGGNIMATIVCENFRPQMATVRPGVMKACERNTALVGETIEKTIDFVPQDMNIKIRKVVKDNSKTVDIADAKILVSAGRGIGDPENLHIIQELADTLGGEVSSSRACVDAGWLPKDKQVGQTGKTVRPHLYIACGISGAIQHLSGMEDSEIIISINKNETAPIFDVSDLGIVGDIRIIIPKLTAALKKNNEEKALNI